MAATPGTKLNVMSDNYLQTLVHYGQNNLTLCYSGITIPF